MSGFTNNLSNLPPGVGAGDIERQQESPDDLIAAAGTFAQAVIRPENLRQSWADGTEPFDCVAAGKILNGMAADLLAGVESYFGQNTEGLASTAVSKKPKR